MYDLNLRNGDTGILRKNERGHTTAFFIGDNGDIRSIVASSIPAMETAFAMTIHKSQGSEFDDVFVVLPSGEDNSMLTRELVYTAVTRARKNVIIQCEEASLLRAAKTQVQRSSGIAQRFNSFYKAKSLNS